MDRPSYRPDLPPDLARAIANAIVKEQTFCGELRINRQSLNEILEGIPDKRNKDTCTAEFNEKTPLTHTQGIHAAIANVANDKAESIKQQYFIADFERTSTNERNSIRDFLTPELKPPATKDAIRNQIERGMNEILGLQPYQPARNEKAPDHGLTCTHLARENRTSPSIHNINQCTKKR
jgi:hypothetical protein